MMALCPICHQESRFKPVGPFHSRCTNCGASMPNEQIPTTDDDRG